MNCPTKLKKYCYYYDRSLFFKQIIKFFLRNLLKIKTCFFFYNLENFIFYFFLSHLLLLFFVLKDGVGIVVEIFLRNIRHTVLHKLHLSHFACHSSCLLYTSPSPRD